MDGYLGQIILFAGNYAPQGWALCNGQSLPVNQNQALYSIIGNTYGGNSSAFLLPNLQGRIPLHVGSAGNGQANHLLGQQGGGEFVTLSPNQMPIHTHGFSAPPSGAASTPGNSATPIGCFPATFSDSQGVAIQAYSKTANGTMGGGNISGTSSPAGGGQPFSVMQPYLTINFIICISGLYPARP
jgi:microcystin-dependent protein